MIVVDNEPNRALRPKGKPWTEDRLAAGRLWQDHGPVFAAFWCAYPMLTKSLTWPDSHDAQSATSRSRGQHDHKAAVATPTDTPDSITETAPEPTLTPVMACCAMWGVLVGRGGQMCRATLSGTGFKIEPMSVVAGESACGPRCDSEQQQRKGSSN